MTNPLWTCPACDRPFANRNQSHSCGDHSVAAFLEGKSEAAVRLFWALIQAIGECGPLSLAPAKTRVGIQVRMIFAAVNGLLRDGLRAHLVLVRKVQSERFFRMETVGGRHVHHFRLHDEAEIDEELRGWIREAYAVGQQRPHGGGRV